MPLHIKKQMEINQFWADDPFWHNTKHLTREAKALAVSFRCEGVEALL